MSARYCIEITDGESLDYCFTYFDTFDHLADHLFSYLFRIRMNSFFGMQKRRQNYS